MEVRDSSTRDIGQIIAAVRQQIPEVIVWQLQKTHPADDDGIWYFSLPEASNDVQIENSSGMCPFLVETDEQSSHRARTGQTVEETVQMILAYLLPLRRTADARRI